MIKNIQLDKINNEIRLSVRVNPIAGITDGSTLEITINDEGIVADLWEVTERCNGSDCDCTATFGNTFDEFAELLK